MKHKKLIAVLSALFMSATLVSPALADASGTSSAGEVNITFDDYAIGTDVTTIPGFSKGDGDTGTATVAYVDGDTSNKVMKVTGHFETPVGLSLKLLNSEATTGRYKLSFREYAINDDGKSGILVELPYSKAAGHQPAFRLHAAYRNGGLSNFVPSQANWVLYNGWTTFEYLIDLDEKSISVKITDANGTVIQEDTGIADNSSEENTADNYRFLKSLQNLRFRMWSDEEYYFDDIKFEKVASPSAWFADKDGKKVTDISALAAGTTINAKLKLDAADVPGYKLTNYVAFYDAANNLISATGETVAFDSDNAWTGKSVPVPDGAKTVRAFYWNDDMVPLF